MKRNEDQSTRKPAWSTALAVAAGFSFYVLCMILPLVGPSGGSRVEHTAKNKATFLMVLFTTLVLAAASTYVSLKRKKEDGTALPRFSPGVCVVCLCFLVILLFNGFAI